MVVDERVRRLHAHLHELLGPEDAATLIEHLSPVPWADLATKSDLADLATKADLAELRSDVGQIQNDVAELRSDVGQLRSDFENFKVETREEFLKIYTRFEVLEIGMKSGFESQRNDTRALVFEQTATILDRMVSQTRSMIFALVSTLLVLATVFLATG